MVGSDSLLPWLQANLAWVLPLAWAFVVLTLATVACVAWPVTNPTRGHATPRWRQVIAHPATFALSALAMVFLFRLPVILGGTMQNPDEPQLVSGAITLRYQPVFWKSVDGNTTGPLSYMAPMWSWLFGEAPGLATARITGLLLWCGTLGFTWASLRRLTNESIARIGVLAGVLWLAFTQHWEFAQYASEQVSVCLLAGASWQLVRLLTGPERPLREEWRGWALAGFTLATLSLAKLQSAPAAAAVVLVALTVRWRTRPRPFEFACTAGVLAAGALALGALLGIYLLVWGLTAQFRFSYIDSNVVYVSAVRPTLRDLIGQFLGMRHEIPPLGDFVHGVFWPALAGLVAYPWLPRELRPRLVAALVVWCGAAVSVLSPGRGFGHYLQFVIAPAVMLAGIAVWTLTEALARRPQGTAWRAALLGIFAACAVVAPLRRQLLQAREHFGFRAATSWASSEPAGRVAARLTERGERIGVWGWAPGIYVTAERPQATRDGTTERQILSTRLRDAFRVRYLTDLQRSHAPLFVDAVGGNNFAYDQATRVWAAHETWPELAAYIAEHYRFVTEVEGSRLYLRKDLVEARAGRLSTQP